MRYGYFLPNKGLFGDNACAKTSENIYKSMGLDVKFADRFDGVSVIVTDDGKYIYRVVLRGFFDGKIKITDLPMKHDFVRSWAKLDISE